MRIRTIFIAFALMCSAAGAHAVIIDDQECEKIGMYAENAVKQIERERIAPERTWAFKEVRGRQHLMDAIKIGAAMSRIRHGISPTEISKELVSDCKMNRTIWDGTAW